jgi:hypothetical protein
MSSLTSAHLQRRYTIIVVAVLICSAVLFGGVFLFGQSSATITVTPRSQAVTASLTRTIGAVNNADTLQGTVTTDTVSATVDAKPSTSGTPVDAHATGTMHIVNNSSKAQPLASGTRFRAANGQIVRSTKRIDVNPGETVSVTVVADALGVSGNLEPGRFIIVALWPGLQSAIYGDLKEAMTGGTTIAGATLDLPALTAASDAAQSQLASENRSTDTTIILLTPKSVTTSPKSSVASSSYKVTVTMTRLKIMYAPKDVTTALRDALTAAAPEGTSLISADAPSITLKDASDAQHPVVVLRATGAAAISAATKELAPALFAGKSKDEVTATISSLSSVSGVSIAITPSWKKNLPADTTKITVQITTP